MSYCILFFSSHYSACVCVCVCVCVLVYNACTEYTMASHYIKSPMGHNVHVHVCIEDHSYTSLGHYMRLYAHVPTNAQLKEDL